MLLTVLLKAAVYSLKNLLLRHFMCLAWGAPLFSPPGFLGSYFHSSLIVLFHSLRYASVEDVAYGDFWVFDLHGRFWRKVCVCVVVVVFLLFFATPFFPLHPVLSR